MPPAVPQPTYVAPAIAPRPVAAPPPAPVAPPAAPVNAQAPVIAPGATPAGAATLLPAEERLKRLKELRDNRLIPVEIYERRRKEILQELQKIGG